MSAFEKTTKISAKGQLTLPKPVRDALHSDVVRIVVEDDGMVRLEPVVELAGSLKSYAKTYIPIDEAREKAWKAVADERKHPRS